MREESPARAAALLPLAPLGWLYGAGAALHRSLYRCGARPVARLPGHVVSVGALVVGGSAKTPAAAWVAAALRQRGRKVVLASRGYAPGRRGRERVHVVSDGRFVRSRAEIAGAAWFSSGMTRRQRVNPTMPRSIMKTSTSFFAARS